MDHLVTLSTLHTGLRGMGVEAGATLLVHCSLSSLGHVQGGAQTLIQALTDVVGESGTLMMDAFSAGRIDPSEWRNPPVPEALWDRLRFDVPLFDAAKTPTDVGMSKVNELFRTWPGAGRSEHPHTSFAAWGRHRDALLTPHHLHDRLGETSPLARLYDLQADVLFIGTGYATNTAFHLAEYRQQTPPIRDFQIVTLNGGVRQLIEYQDVDTESSRFEAIGAAFDGESAVVKGLIGQATCRRFTLCSAVDFATGWLNKRN